MGRAHRVQILMRIGYDGGRFHGVQHQPGLPTVGAALWARLAEAAGKPPKALQFTSRTDAGVHALGNLATAWFPPPVDVATLLAALTTSRPDGLDRVEAWRISRRVGARGLSRGKHYRYLVETGHSAAALEAIEARVSWRARGPERRGEVSTHPDPTEARRWHIHPVPDLGAMERAAAHLLGTHDFSALRSARCTAPTPVRTLWSIDIGVDRSGPAPLFTFDIRGEAFLRQMVRIIVGTLLEVGVGMRAPGSLPALLASGHRRSAGFTAPSRGLTLVEILLRDDLKRQLQRCVARSGQGEIAVTHPASGQRDP